MLFILNNSNVFYLVPLCFEERCLIFTFLVIIRIHDMHCFILLYFVLWIQAKFHIIQELLGKLHATVANKHRGEMCDSLLKELNEERQIARSFMKNMFNSSFGATFLTDTGQESAFAYNIHQYADVYTSKPENFLLYPPEAWLHVPFDIKIMPHHLKVNLMF